MSCALAWAANAAFGVALPSPVLAPLPAPALLPPLLGVAPSAAGGLLGGSGRAKLVWEVLREGRDPFDEGSGLGQNTRAALHEHFSPPAHEMLATSVSECGTRKLLLRLPRGDEVETVIIPHRGFSTLCVSSQVGCRQGCTFCATGTMGLLRSLTADEILLQLHAASAAVREHGMPPLRNVVFMGMGEPADNVEHVAGALHAHHDTRRTTRHTPCSPACIQAVTHAARLPPCAPPCATTLCVPRRAARHDAPLRLPARQEVRVRLHSGALARAHTSARAPACAAGVVRARGRRQAPQAAGAHHTAHHGGATRRLGCVCMDIWIYGCVCACV